MSENQHSQHSMVPSSQSRQNRFQTRALKDLWHNASDRLQKVLPVESVSRLVSEWFDISDDRIAEILAQVRAQLPTTEALLVGKPQAGKSSLVRGMTGVCEEIIGQGFRPHTQNTERYNYPSDDLPLLVFTDTVGLGDVNQDAQAIASELLGDLQAETTRARVLILTVKINDFATDTLQQIARQIRKQHPEIPCLLAITNLHELYPADVENHPTYPPNYEEVDRAVQALQESFSGWCDRSVLVDFTLEEDGYTPVFYGLETLRDTLADLLPEAEARAIYQLLDKEASQELSHLYRDVARRYILPFSIAAATVAAVPLPFATMPVLTALQVSMVGLLGKLYRQSITRSQAGGVVSAIAGGFLAQLVGRELVKFVPGFGSAIAASWAAAYTWALGEGACVYFGDLMGGKKPDPAKIQSAMRSAFDEAKERFK
nr:GTPase [Geitlerinema sp. PCC 9228]